MEGHLEAEPPPPLIFMPSVVYEVLNCYIFSEVLKLQILKFLTKGKACCGQNHIYCKRKLETLFQNGSPFCRSLLLWDHTSQQKFLGQTGQSGGKTEVVITGFKCISSFTKHQ